MSLNIKNQETCDLVDKIAVITGENKTQAIHNALLARLKVIGANDDIASELISIGKICSENTKVKINGDDLLYDDLGLPK